MTTVMVAGSGRCGLHTARILAANGIKVTVVERLPESGGQEPERDARRLHRAARRAGAEFMLGTLAVAYRNGRVDTLGVQGAQSTAVRCLVLATGTRPQTRAELGIGGDRGAGVMPGSAALHFLDSGLLMGKSPVVIGHGELALHLGETLLARGAHEVTSVASQPRIGQWPKVIRRLDDASVVSVQGFPRVRSATVAAAEGTLDISTDSVILASGRVPMRNVEGAIFPGPNVVDCFSAGDPKADDEAVRVARSAVARVLSVIS